MKYSIKEFAHQIRSRFPGDYDDLSDEKLVTLWLKKYPGDQDKIDFNAQLSNTTNSDASLSHAKQDTSGNFFGTIGNILLVAFSIFVLVGLYLEFVEHKNIIEMMGFKKTKTNNQQNKSVNYSSTESQVTPPPTNSSNARGTYTCSKCNGSGSTNGCTCCYGKGVKQCWKCNGKGYRNDGSTCLDCRGRGFNDCSHCLGSPSSVEEKCSVCQGIGIVTHEVCDNCNGVELKSGQHNYLGFYEGTHCFNCDGKGYHERPTSN